jgi:hypothetical protein
MKIKLNPLFLILLLMTSAVFWTGCSDDSNDNDNSNSNGNYNTSPNWFAKEIVITTEEELREFAVLVNGGKNFFNQTITLGQNINLSDNKWVPIGDLSVNPFRGTFNGNGNLIRGIGESNTIEGFSGLFGYLYGGTIKNLGVVVDINISEFSAVAIAGLAVVNVGTISNCYVAGDITISPMQGNFIGSTIVAMNNGRIENSYAKADITTSNFVGRFVGENNGTIENCYALERIAEESDDDKFAVYNYGTICEDSALKSADDMKNIDIYINWDFENIWAIAPNTNDGFPYLRFLR